MDEEREMVLRMLKEGKVTVEEADALLQELVEQRWEDEGGSTTAPPPPSSPGVPDVREELRTVFQDLMDSIPKDVIRELKQAREAFRPGFFQVVRGLRGLAEGRAETTAEEVMRAGDQVVLSNVVELDVVSGDIQLGTIRGDVRLDVRSGDIAAREVSGAMRGRIIHGDVSIQEVGDLSLDMIHGDVAAARVTGNVDVETKSGDIALANAHAREVRMRTLSGDVEVSLEELGDGPVTVETISGDIEVGLPASARATIDASTRSGSIHSVLTLQQPTGDRRSLRGILNAPGPTVRLSATSGDIEIRESRR